MTVIQVRGMNALFGMRSKISIGDRTIVATATATACLLSCLPRPSQPKLICTASSAAMQQVRRIQFKRVYSKTVNIDSFFYCSESCVVCRISFQIILICESLARLALSS